MPELILLNLDRSEFIALHKAALKEDQTFQPISAPPPHKVKVIV